jgi:amino acid adenylation domain-containing protein
MLPQATQDSKFDSTAGNGGHTTAGDKSSIATISRMTESQLNQVLYEWNQTRVDVPDTSTHKLFEQQVERDPEAVAVVGGGASLTYGELNRRANQVAHFLRRHGVGPEVLVGVCLRRSPQLVVALLGVWKAGGAYVPLDSEYPEERLSFMVSDAGVRVLLTEEQCKHLFAAVDANVVCLDTDWPAIEQENDSNPNNGVAPANLAYVMYTSGSTGKPKGAMILHRGLVNYLCWAIGAYGVRPGGSVPVHSSISFDLTVTSLYPALLAGGQVELLAEDVGAQNLLAALRRQKNRTLVKITPAHLEALSLQLGSDEVAGMTNVFVIGGENLPAEGLRLWRESAPATRLINEYGPTETVVGCCVYEVQPGDPNNGPVPIGRPIANTQLYILDESLDPLPPGEMGELYIGGAGVARGYLNRPELTEERFLPDPFCGNAEARMYKTGDLARYRADGVIEYMGRVDNQVKLRGYRIELGEIEAVLAGHPAVQSCAVLAREDKPGDKRLVGYLVARDGKPPATGELQSFLEERLPEYMVPAKFVVLDAFPLTHNGKVDRKALPAPAAETAQPGSQAEAPRNSAEEAIAAIWKEMFKLDQVGIHDDFFDLGGHSLLAIKVMSRLRDQFGIDLPVLNLFENPTIASLAVNLQQAMAAHAPEGSEETAQLAHESRESKKREERRGVQPFYFGAADAPLFGVYSPPNAVAKDTAVLICAPIALEYMRTHYTIRLVAQQLARAGFPVLRFDYHAEGDSSGQAGPGRFDVWINDVALAARELTERSGARSLTVVGLRMGAAFAVEALARKAITADSLLLCDPVVSGREYMATLDRLHAEFVAGRKKPLKPTDELLGEHFPQDLRTAIEGVDIAGRIQNTGVKRAALVVSEDLPQYGALLKAMQSQWPQAALQNAGDPIDWTSLKAAFRARITGPIVRAVAEAVESLR